MLDLLDKSAVSYQLVLTKADELKAKDVAARLAGVEAALKRRPAAFPGVILTSAHKGEGIAELRAAVAALLAERGDSF
jgi:GTP-binding protein